MKETVLLIGSLMVCSAIAGAVVGKTYSDRKYHALIDEYESKAVMAEIAARQQQELWEQKKDAAVKEAQEWGKKNEKAANAANAELNRLRRALDLADRELSGATDRAVAEYAVAANALLAECSGRYSELAAAADGHANDVRRLIGAWPAGGMDDRSQGN